MIIKKNIFLVIAMFLIAFPLVSAFGYNTVVGGITNNYYNNTYANYTIVNGSSYNVTYEGSINNASYLSTFNTTYDTWSYNQSGVASGSTFNITYEGSSVWNITGGTVRLLNLSNHVSIGSINAGADDSLLIQANGHNNTYVGISSGDNNGNSTIIWRELGTVRWWTYANNALSKWSIWNANLDKDVFSIYQTNGLVNVTNNLSVGQLLFAPNICYSNGTNCNVSAGSTFNITYHSKADYNFTTNSFNGSGNFVTTGNITTSGLRASGEVWINDTLGRANNLGNMIQHLEEMSSDTLLDKSRSTLSILNGELNYTLYALDGVGDWNFNGTIYAGPGVSVANATVTLACGTNSTPKLNYIYWKLVANVPTMVTAETYPTEVHIDTATFYVGACEGNTSNIYSYSRNRYEVDSFIKKVLQRFEEAGTLYVSGFVPTVNTTTINVSSGGKFFNGIFEMTSTNFIDGKSFYWINATGNFIQANNLSSLNQYQDGTAFDGTDRMNVVWGLVPINTTGGVGPTQMRLVAVPQTDPGGARQYVSAIAAEQDQYEVTNYFPPNSEVKNVFVPIARTIVRASTAKFEQFANGAYYRDIRGKITVGGGAATSVDISHLVPYINATSNVDVDGFNITSTWFKGLFNWTILSNWFSWDNSALDFNETKLNLSISDYGIKSGFNSTFNTTYSDYSYNHTTSIRTNSSVCAGTDKVKQVNISNGILIVSCEADSTSSSGVYNVTYNASLIWQYNQTILGDYNYNQSLAASTYNETYKQWSYNMSLYASIYNVTYSGLINNDTYLSNYNSTYHSALNFSYNMSLTASTYNETYKLYAYNMTTNSIYYYNLTLPAMTYEYNFTTIAVNTYNVTYSNYAYNQSSSSSSTMNYTDYHTNGTWIKPAGATKVDVVCIGAGGGGGGGKMSAANAIRTGGGGGGGAAVIKASFFANELPASVSIFVGSGGKGGNCTGTLCTSTAGSDGENSSFGVYLVCYGGGGGAAGTTSVVAGGGGASTGAKAVAAAGGNPSSTAANATGGQGTTATTSVVLSAEWGGATGSFTKITAGNGTPAGSSIYGCPGGGAGAGMTNAQVAAQASAGGSTGTYMLGGGGAGGITGNTTLTAGANGDLIHEPYCGTGGGGGGGMNSTAGGLTWTFGKNGGIGGYGAGGGGGGAGTVNITTSTMGNVGAFGGQGGNGTIMIWAY